RTSEPATNTPPYAARMRPKCASGWRLAKNPYRPRAITPAPIHNHPRCSRNPCHTSQAPPISNSAAPRNRTIDRAVFMVTILRDRVAQRVGLRSASEHLGPPRAARAGLHPQAVPGEVAVQDVGAVPRAGHPRRDDGPGVRLPASDVLRAEPRHPGG